MAPTRCPSTGKTTKVIFYMGPNAGLTLNKNGTLNGDSSNGSYDPKSFQVYMYGINTNNGTDSKTGININPNLIFNSNGTSAAFIFAPNMPTIFNSNGTLYGSLWTKRVTVNADARIYQSPLSYSDLAPELQPTSPTPNTSQKINLGNVSSWERQSAN
jgi:hypothetical protein